jgi:hypothetical protein
MYYLCRISINGAKLNFYFGGKIVAPREQMWILIEFGEHEGLR